MTDKKKILFVNDEMRMGGVARVLNTLMANLPKDKYEIDLLILHKQGMLLDEIPEGINIIEGTTFFRPVDESLDALVKGFHVFETCRKLRLLFYMKTGLIKGKIKRERKKILSKTYDVEVAAKEGFCTIFTAYGDSKRKINWVLTDYSVCNYSKNHMGLVKDALRYIDLNIADSNQALIAYETVFRVQNGIAIHNLMDTSNLEKGLLETHTHITNKETINIIDVARLHPQKGIDRLIKASTTVFNEGLKHELYLIGGGELEDELHELVKSLNATHVHFLGFQKNPYRDIAECDLFVLSSLYEGFATIINESLIVGTPVLTTRVSGCEEQITEACHGWIVENSEEALTSGLRNALKDKDKLKEMKHELSKYKYDNDGILKEFMDVL